MANTGCQVFAFVLCFIALVGYSVCIGSNQWKITNRGKAVVVATVLYQGLWKSCAGDTLGSQQCRSYYTVLQLPPYMRASQAMMIIGMILTLMGILLSLFGMKCSRIGDDDPAIKGRIIAVGGIMNILASFSVITVISYFAWQVTVDFYNPAVKIKYDYGLALYVGWGACVLSLLGGSMMCFGCMDEIRGRKSFEEHHVPKQSFGAPYSESSVPMMHQGLSGKPHKDSTFSLPLGTESRKVSEYSPPMNKSSVFSKAAENRRQTLQKEAVMTHDTGMNYALANQQTGSNILSETAVASKDAPMDDVTSNTTQQPPNMLDRSQSVGMQSYNHNAYV